jgi:hypothetical protein
VIVCERFDLDIAKLYLKEVTDKLGELGLTRLLLERRVCGTLSNIKSHLAIAFLFDNGPAGLKTAVVDGDPDNRRRLDFGARTSEVGAHRFQIFETTADAMKWLDQV